MNKNLDGLVATIENNGLLVIINKGAMSGVKEGMRYLIYNKGEEIRDPETNAPLGTLEIVCGKGIVTHVQPNMATIKCCEKDTSVSKISRPKWPLGGLEQLVPETEERTVRTLPFEGVEIGSFARYLG